MACSSRRLDVSSPRWMPELDALLHRVTFSLSTNVSYLAATEIRFRVLTIGRPAPKTGDRLFEPWRNPMLPGRRNIIDGGRTSD